jgi:hypothetical protein
MQWYLFSKQELPAQPLWAGAQCGDQPQPNPAERACHLLEHAIELSRNQSALSVELHGSEGSCMTPRALTGLQGLSLSVAPATTSPAGLLSSSSPSNITWQSSKAPDSAKAPVCPGAPQRPRPMFALIPACELPCSVAHAQQVC